jgi:hypothetical protein
MREARAGLDRQDPDMVVGYFLLDATRGWVGPGSIFWGDRGREVYYGERGGRPYCIMVDLYDSRSPKRAGVPPELGPPRLNQCLTFVRHGRPGPAVHEWLARGGIEFLGNASQAADLPALAAMPTFGLGRLFGFRYNNIAEILCLAGDPNQCEQVVVEADWTSPSDRLSRDLTPFVPTVDVYYFRSSRSFSRFLGVVEAEFGPERFHSFWTSNEDVSIAFAEAFGIGMGDWILGWLARNERRVAGSVVTPHLYRGGPGMTWVTWISALLVWVLGAAIATGFWRRVQVGS